MVWTIAKIKKGFGGKLIGNPHMKRVVIDSVLLLPPEIIDYVTKKVWILSSPEDAWAMTFRGDEIKDRHLIFLSDELLRESEEQIRYTLLHEIGHVILNHRNSIGYEQTESEIKHQEIEADKFAKKYTGNK
jgi:Zn-dependent protease with chaperone function